MKEFKAMMDQATVERRDRLARLSLWGIVALLIALTLFVVYGPRAEIRSVSSQLLSLAAGAVIATVALAYYLAYWHAKDTIQDALTFELTEGILIRRQSGRPDIQLKLSEIRQLTEDGTRLIIQGALPDKRIVVPKAVQDFPELRAELNKYAHVAQAPTSSSFRVIFFFAYAASCACVLWSADTLKVEVAAGIGFLLLVWQSIWLYKLAQSNRKQPPLMWLILLAWLGAALLVYFRLH
jgi:hypothetical protein